MSEVLEEELLRIYYDSADQRGWLGVGPPQELVMMQYVKRTKRRNARTFFWNQEEEEVPRYPLYPLFPPYPNQTTTKQRLELYPQNETKVLSFPYKNIYFASSIHSVMGYSDQTQNRKLS